MTATPTKPIECAKNCSVRDAVECELGRRTPERIDYEELYAVDDNELLGYYADDSFYDRLIDEDCDIYLKGEKVLSFRKALMPKLRDKDKRAWEYFRWAARDLYSDSRGNVAGKELNTDMDVRVSAGAYNFFKAASAGKVTTEEEARKIISSSPDPSKYHCRVGNVKKDWPDIDEKLKPVESALRKKKCTMAEREIIKLERGAILQSWFPRWFEDVWVAAPDEERTGLAKKAFSRYVSTQIRANKCYSNILGAMDRSARAPYCRLSMSTKKKPEEFRHYKDVYQTACAALHKTIPARWESLYSRFGKVADPSYNLFGTCFTTLTMNWNFRTAFHRDANNCEGGIAVLTAMTQGEYEGHYLVFPELRVAFNLRDGDFLAGDNQGLIHGNTAMIPLSEDAERVSFVFYSRERMPLMEDMECENCRREFMMYSKENLTEEHGTGHKGWNGLYEGMWHSPEWLAFKKEAGLERCGTTNWWCTEN